MLTACKDELPNPHKDCIRETLNTLICHDNDLRRINLELENLQNEYQHEMKKVEYRCMELRSSPPICSENQDGEKIEGFSQHISVIDEMHQCFKNKIDALKNDRQQLLKDAKDCLYQLNMEKCKMKKFHEKTTEYLKCLAIRSNDPQVIQNCEKDMCEMHKRFVKEVIFIKKCEQELLPLFQQLSDKDLNDYCSCCCFNDYDWLPKGKSFEVVNQLANDIEQLMGKTLINAFAQYHLHQHGDCKNFLALYLMNLQSNEELLQAKLNLFSNF